MDRRTFLKGLLGAAAIAAIPAPILADFYEEKTNILDCGGFIIDLDTHIITVKPGNPNGVSLIDMYKKLKSVWYHNGEARKHYFPLVPHTKEHMETQGGWKLSSRLDKEVIKNGGWL